VIKDKPVSVAIWYQQPTEARKRKSPDEIVEEIKKSKSPMTTDPYGDKSAGIQQIKDRLKVQGQAIHFSKIESKAIDGLTTYANVLLEIHGPESKEHPGEQYALIQMVKYPNSGRKDWVVQDFKFPYTPASAVVSVPQKHDDGHGH
jgi:hypothetical protein